MEKFEPCAEQLNELVDFTKLIVAPACGHAEEKATKLVDTFPAAVLTTTTPFSRTKSLILRSCEERFTVRIILLVGLVLLFVLLLLLELLLPG